MNKRFNETVMNEERNGITVPPTIPVKVCCAGTTGPYIQVVVCLGWIDNSVAFCFLLFVIVVFISAASLTRVTLSVYSFSLT